MTCQVKQQKVIPDIKYQTSSFFSIHFVFWVWIAYSPCWLFPFCLSTLHSFCFAVVPQDVRIGVKGAVSNVYQPILAKTPPSPFLSHNYLWLVFTVKSLFHFSQCRREQKLVRTEIDQKQSITLPNSVIKTLLLLGFFICLYSYF